MVPYLVDHRGIFRLLLWITEHWNALHERHYTEEALQLDGRGVLREFTRL